MSFRSTTLGLGLFLLLRSASVVYAQDHQIIRLDQGATEDVYFEINLSGKVFLSIRSPDGVGCVDLWWIEWPLGSVEQLGNRCGNISVPIPGIWNFAVSSKLRARAGSKPIAIVASASESIANNFPPVSFP